MDFPGLEYEPKPTATALSLASSRSMPSVAEHDAPDRAAGAATAPPTPPQSSRPRRRSILKTTDPDSPTASSSRRRHSTTDADGGGGDRSAAAAAASRPPRRRVSFTSVDIQEHDLTLGDHPEVSWGPPTSLGWTVQRRHSVDLEDYEAEREPRRRPHRKLAISYYDRKNMLRNAGHTKEEMKEATKTANRTKTMRQITRSYANTPAGKVEELLFSATRKFKRAVGIAPSKKNAARDLENLQRRASCDSPPDYGNGGATEDRASERGMDWKQDSLQRPPVPRVAVEHQHKRLAPASA